MSRSAPCDDHEEYHWVELLMSTMKVSNFGSKGKRMYRKYGRGFFAAVFRNMQDVRDTKPITITTGPWALGCVSNFDRERVCNGFLIYRSTPVGNDEKYAVIEEMVREYDPAQAALLVCILADESSLAQRSFAQVRESSALGLKVIRVGAVGIDGLTSLDHKPMSQRKLAKLCGSTDAKRQVGYVNQLGDQITKYVESSEVTNVLGGRGVPYVAEFTVSEIIPPELSGLMGSASCLNSAELQKLREELLTDVVQGLEEHGAEFEFNNDEQLSIILNRLVPMFGSYDAYTAAVSRCHSVHAKRRKCNSWGSRSDQIQSHLRCTALGTESSCFVCGSTVVKACQRCLNTFYCSRVCQKKDWKRHKYECEQNIGESPQEQAMSRAKKMFAQLQAGSPQGANLKLVEIAKQLRQEAQREIDEYLAIEMFKLGHNRGELEATLELGKHYRYGRPVERDCDFAFTLILQAHTQGLSEASLILGNMYCDGEGVDQDFDKAKELYLEAMAHGNQEAAGAMQVLTARLQQ